MNPPIVRKRDKINNRKFARKRFKKTKKIKIKERFLLFEEMRECSSFL
jgi:hypothetical protein